MNLTKREQLELMRGQGTFQRKEKIRLALFIVGLVLMIGLLVTLQQDDKPETAPVDPSLEAVKQSMVALPQLEEGTLDEVKDAENENRILLESKAFAALARLSRALLPGHLKAIGEPSLPFAEVAKHPADFRGKPFRMRGALLHARQMIRVIGSPSEYWCHVSTDEGHEFFFVSTEVPKELFGSENYILADGYFFKIYTQNIDGKQVTAPLLVGRTLRPSKRLAEPALVLDPVILADVKDPAFGVDEELHQAGLWHLLNYAYHLGQDLPRLETEFENAAYLNRPLTQTIAKQPELFRGKAVIINAKAATAFTIAAEENPLGLPFISHAYLSKYELDDQFLRVVGPGGEIFDNHGLDRELLGYFLQLWAYVDTKDQPRRTPVFVVAGWRPRILPEPLIEGQITFIFIGIAVSLGILLTWLALKDKRQSQDLAQSLLQRRQSRRQKK